VGQGQGRPQEGECQDEQRGYSLQGHWVDSGKRYLQGTAQKNTTNSVNKSNSELDKNSRKKALSHYLAGQNVLGCHLWGSGE
jgi:hypothetical protein